MGTRKQQEKQEDLWIAHTELASAPGHPFYQRLNELLEAERFEALVEGPLREVLCGQMRAAVADARDLFSFAADRIFRTHRKRSAALPGGWLARQVARRASKWAMSRCP